MGMGVVRGRGGSPVIEWKGACHVGDGLWWLKK